MKGLLIDILLFITGTIGARAVAELGFKKGSLKEEKVLFILAIVVQIMAAIPIITTLIRFSIQ